MPIAPQQNAMKASMESKPDVSFADGRLQVQLANGVAFPFPVAENRPGRNLSRAKSAKGAKGGAA